MRHLITLISMLSILYSAIGQQEQHYSQYLVNGYVINPAMGGTEDYIDIKLGARAQWVGFEDAPKTIYLSAHTALGKDFNNSHNHHRGEHQSWHGVGGYLYSDNTGTIARTSAYASYAYNLPLANRGKLRLSLGAFGGLKQFKYDPGEHVSTLHDKGDALAEAATNKVLPDVTLGFWMYSKEFYVGGSIFQVLDNEIGTAIKEDTEEARLTRHYIVTAGYKARVNQQFSFIPSFAIKGNTPAPVSVDLSAKVDYDDQYWGAISVRGGDAFIMMVGTVINKQLELSYSYDLTYSDIRKASTGSHEIVIGYRLKHPGHLVCPSGFW